jgi:hypothetical protein
MNKGEIMASDSEMVSLIRELVYTLQESAGHNPGVAGVIERFNAIGCNPEIGTLAITLFDSKTGKAIPIDWSKHSIYRKRCSGKPN